MGLIADNKAFKAAYSMLTDDQIERFFPGQEAQARKAIESLVWLLGDRLSYDRALELYLTVAVRVTMSFEKERIHSTLKLRFSDIMPDNKALTVIDCIGRIKKNFDTRPQSYPTLSAEFYYRYSSFRVNLSRTLCRWFCKCAFFL